MPINKVGVSKANSVLSLESKTYSCRSIILILLILNKNLTDFFYIPHGLEALFDSCLPGVTTLVVADVALTVEGASVWAEKQQRSTTYYSVYKKKQYSNFWSCIERLKFIPQKLPFHRRKDQTFSFLISLTFL